MVPTLKLALIGIVALGSLILGVWIAFRMRRMEHEFGSNLWN